MRKITTALGKNYFTVSGGKVNSVVYKGCLKKVRFAQKKRAKQAKKSCKTKYGCTFSVYKCKYCNGYHLTTKTQENQNGARQ